MKTENKFSSGIPALDEILQGVLEGDNVVFQVDNLMEYIPFVNAFCRSATINKKDLIYLRFAEHEFLLPENVHATVYDLNPEKGFEFFISQIIDIIESHGYYACYVFDSLSELSVGWYSNAMLGNFFMLICPYLYEYKTVAYFALFRHLHDSKTFMDIHKTAQVIFDVYEKNNEIYIHPIKVMARFSSTLYTLHKWKNAKDPKSDFQTIKESAIIAEILSEKHYQWLELSKLHLDAWNLSFQKAEEILEGLLLGEISLKQSEIFKSRLLKKIIVQDNLLFPLAMVYFDLNDLLSIGKRIIGTGYIGGKSTGMLLSRAILRKEKPELHDKLEIQDSFFIATDVFYTFLVENGCWWMKRKLTDPETFLQGQEEARKKILSGSFPQSIIEKFKELLDYFGQTPIIVRSSSLQEDAYGNSFSGKYSSYFLANQGNIEERLNEFMNAIRKVYASTIGTDAMTYRKNRGLLDKDEQMSILVQRVSGSIYGDYFFPQVAGVGLSFNPYVWNEAIDSHSGFLRLVLGLGTRAVERIEDDFTTLVALNKPLLRVEGNLEDIRKFSQKKIDLLNLRKNIKTTEDFWEMNFIEDFPIQIFGTQNLDIERKGNQKNKENYYSWVITFKNLLKNGQFIQDMQEMLATLEKVYHRPIDIEFTVNFFEDNIYKINLLQCRPFQIKYQIKDIVKPEDIQPDSIIFQSSGPIIGPSTATKIDKIIFIDPTGYSDLNISDKHKLARLIGKINQLSENTEDVIMLLGPGRWGTSTVSLGIPVRFAEIHNVSVLCEISEKISGMIPDVSLGTHFFNNLVELDMMYVVIYPEKENFILKKDFFKNAPNCLPELIEDSDRWINIIKVIDTKDDRSYSIHININAYTQKGLCYKIMK